MRVVGIALMVSVLCGGCALQAADGTDEAAAGGEPSSATPAAAAGVHVGLPSTVQAGPGSGGPTGAPAPCTGPGPECDPQPQPWGGRPPNYVPTAVKH
jgi:hypothetical protein